MQGIQPRTLSNKELVKYAEMFLDKPEGLPINWQKELLRRYDDVAFIGQQGYTDYKYDTRQQALF